MFRVFLYFIIFLFFSLNLFSADNKIIVASTTSTHDTGLLTYINKIFKDKFNINVQVLSQGTGQAIRTARDGNIEVLLVHHKKSELKFIEDGYGVARHELMYNDFIIVGPKSDNIICDDINTKLLAIFRNNFIFISRGDDSGTHKKEIELWSLINLNPNNFKSQYLKVGQGMGNTLLITNEKRAYTLTDRSTWIAFNKKDNLKVICENLPPLINQYGLILVKPSVNKNLNFEGAKVYVNWLLSDQGKILINSFKQKNQQLFFYNHH